MKGATKTTLTFGEDFALVQVPVAFSPVTKTKDDVKTEFVVAVRDDEGELIGAGPVTETVKRDPTTKEVVTGDEFVRALPNGDGHLPIPDEDWTAITEETKPTEMVVTEFVDPELPVVKDRLAAASDAHYVQPQPGAAGSLAVLVEAMVEAGKVAIVRWGAGSRQRLGILRVRAADYALVVQTVPFAADVRAPDEDVLAPAEAEVSEKARKLGKQLVTRLSGKGETLETAEDEAVALRLKLAEELIGGKKPKRTKKAKAKAETDVEAALEAVLG